MPLTRNLAFFLLTFLFAFLANSARAAAVVDFAWQELRGALEAAGMVVQNDDLRGNALRGVTLSGVRISGWGLELEADEVVLEYALLRLFGGRLPLQAAATGVRGSIDVGEFLGAAQDWGGANFDLTSLVLDDVEVRIHGIPIDAPDLDLVHLRLSGTNGNYSFATRITGADGSASLSGAVSGSPLVVTVAADEADATLARHWWPHITAGTVTGAFTWTAAGMSLDAAVADGAIDFLNLTAGGIAGTIGMSGDVITAELQGSSLGGPVTATAEVDIAAQHYVGRISGEPTLDEAFAWLGRVLDIDLGFVEAEGRATTSLTMEGWRGTSVSGLADASGSLNGLPLAALSGSYGFRTDEGVSVALQAALSGGSLDLRLEPQRAAGNDLHLALSGVRLFPNALPDLLLDGTALLLFPSRGGDPRPGSTAQALLHGRLADRGVTVNLTGTSDDVRVWNILASGGDEFGATLAGNVRLDAAASLASGSVAIAGLTVPGVPWLVAAGITADGAALGLPLSARLTAEAGPLLLGEVGLTLAVDGSGSVSVSEEQGRLDLQAAASGFTLQVAEPPVTLRLGTAAPAQLETSGRVALLDGQLELDGRVALPGASLAASSADGGIEASLTTAGRTLAGRLDTETGEWNLAGDIALAPLSPFVGVALGGSLSGALSGTGTDIRGGTVRGSVDIAGLPLELDVTPGTSETRIAGRLPLLGLDWTVAGTVLPGLDVTATSAAGRLRLAGDAITGSGSLPLPALAGIELLDDQDVPLEELAWAASGSLAAGAATLRLAAGAATVSWGGTGAAISVSGELRQRLSVLGLPALLTAAVERNGAVTAALELPRGSLTASGNWRSGQLALDGNVAATMLHDALAGTLRAGGTLSFDDGFAVAAPLTWTGAEGDTLLEGMLEWSDTGGPTLTAQGPGVEAEWSDGLLTAALTGLDPSPYTNLPLPRLTVTGTASGSLGGLEDTDLIFDMAAELGPLALAASGTLRAGLLRADLATAAIDLGVARLDPLRAEAVLDEGGRLHLSGSGIDLSLGPEGWSGGARITAEVLGDDHSLALTLSGPAAEPTVGAVLSGPAVAGTAEWSGALQLALTTERPLGLLTTASLSGRLDAQGRWNAHVRLVADGFAGASPLVIGAELTGDATAGTDPDVGPLALLGEFSGHANLRAGPAEARILSATISGGAAGARIESDLSSLDVGALAALLGAADLGASLSLSGHASLDLTPAGDLDFAAAGALAAPGLLLDFVLDPSHLIASGTAAGTPLAIDARLGAMPTAAATWGGAELELTSAREGDELILIGTLQAPAASPLGRADGRIAARVSTNSAWLTALELSVAGVTLQASGELLPTLALQGNLQLEAYPAENATLLVTGEGADLLFAGLRARITPQLAIHVTGTLELPQLPPVEVDLGFAPGAGFSGHATAGSQLLLPGRTLPWSLAATADDSGQLQIEGGISRDGVPAGRPPLVELHAQLASDPFRTGALSGRVTARGSLTDVVPAYAGRSVSLSSTLVLGGNLTAPTLRGPVAVDGAVRAEGSVSARLADGIQASLSGVGLEVTAGANGSGWSLAARVEAQPLDPFTTILPGATVGFQLRAGGGAGGFEADVDQLVVRTDNSLVSGSASFRGGLRAELAVALDLADFGADLPLAGRATGTLSLGNELAANLRLSGVSVAGIPALAGNLTVTGPPDDPTLALSLRETFGSGLLDLSWRPAEDTFDLRSTLELAGVATDLHVIADGGRLDASGSIGLAGGSFSIAADDGRLSLTGADSFAGWLLELDPFGGPTATLRGDLASLPFPAGGTVEVTAGLVGNAVQVSGRAHSAQLLGIELGDLTISSANALTGWLNVSGASVQARATLAGAWELARLEVGLADDLNLVASGTGRGARGSLDAAASGLLLGQPLSITLRAEDSGSGTTVSAEGNLLGGTAELAALLGSAGWQGRAHLAGMSWSGIELSAEGGVFGPALEPRIELRTQAGALGLAVTGDVHVGVAQLTFHQRIEGPALTGPVTVSGELWPAPMLRLAGPDGHVFEMVALPDEGSPMDWPLTARGHLSVTLAPLSLSLGAAEDGTADLHLSLLQFPGLAVAGTLELTSASAQIAQFLNGIPLQGREATLGGLRLHLPAGEVVLDDFGLTTPAGDVRMDGRVRLDGTARITGELRPDPDLMAAALFLPQTERVPFAVVSQAGTVRLVSASPLGDLEALFGLEDLRGTLRLWLNTLTGSAELQLAYSPDTGPSGTLHLAGVELFRLGDGPAAALEAHAEVTGARAQLTAELRLGSGRMTVDGDWGLGDFLPDWIAPLGESGGRVDARMGSFELSEIPALTRFTPYVRGGVTGVLQLRDGVVAGSLVGTGVNAAGTVLPVEAIFSGSLQRVDVTATLATSPLTLTITPQAVSGLLDMRRFPLHTLAQAFAGPLDVTAEMTGVARFTLPLNGSVDPDLRLATELIRLERAGSITTGNLSLELSRGLLVVSDAHFEGAGSWRAEGVVREDELDFVLVAEDADFGPMLGLIPALAALGVEAGGTLQAEARGTLSDPLIQMNSPGLDLRMSGIGYRLADLDVTLRGSNLTAAATLLGTDPVGGRLTLRGGAGLALQPLRLHDAAFTFDGSLVIPGLGPVDAVDGAITSAGPEADAGLQLDVTAVLGQPLRVSGSLTPLDITATGRGIRVDLPAVFLRDGNLDVDLRLREDDGLRLSGGIVIGEGQISLGSREGGAGPPVALARNFYFEGVRISAPARLRLAENFGTIEMSGEILLGGTLAAPLLSGRADALRGNFQFAGRDFQLASASAVFEQSRGLFPLLQMTAVTTFDRARLLPSGSNLQLVAPTDSPVVEVMLDFEGVLEPDDATGYTLNVDPVLTSNVLVQEIRSDGVASGVRSLTNSELLSLVALGRIEFDSLVAGEAGLAAAVAQGALDTAVDLLILGELQRALSAALGIDVVEIRSTALSSFISGEADSQFGVSLRFGGYLTEDVFATYTLSAFDDPAGLYAFSNEVGLRYFLGPVRLELAGRLSFPDAADQTPVAELSLGLQYALTQRTGVEAGFDLSSERQQFRVAFTWRW